MRRRSSLLVALLTLVWVVRRRGAAARAEQSLWNEAGVAPDLR